ncbi:hypothetical protein LEP1GSC202_0826 [Leptospira yanagawae serovar Saopaulo str. Sao Paulo = ATCC 700523]|uniref:Uncharacterized protein n=1 Tax=Leptospira yanagawae serovar Saopaulo str. Sao Paulo = ATCC 700523 TaxID=1249483 RepID=A0A5E8HCP8_9LEPT|nr:hypothetical protein LEP1GSC202_0826 [Leptospira yanagawae serovar Saopaulo str. Sao Paulo = ATCC 700523]
MMNTKNYYPKMVFETILLRDSMDELSGFLSPYLMHSIAR